MSNNRTNPQKEPESNQNANFIHHTTVTKSQRKTKKETKAYTSSTKSRATTSQMIFNPITKQTEISS